MRKIERYVISETEALLLTRDLDEAGEDVRMYECHEATAPAPYLVTEQMPTDLPNDWGLTFDPSEQDLVDTEDYIGRERRRFIRVPMRMPVSVSLLATA